MPWFEAKSGARGWVVGRLVCLWLSAFDRYGPMVFAWISSDRSGSRISGRAGSDLNGLIWLLLTVPILAFCLVQMVMEGDASRNVVILYGGILAVGVPLTLWLSHKDRRDADPLVSFLRRVAGHGAGSLQRVAHLSDERHAIKVDVSGRHWASAISDRELFEAMAGLANGDFIVLATADEEYMQVASTPLELIVEKRQGSGDQHFRATLPKGGDDSSGEYDASLMRAFEVLSSFVKGHRPEGDLSWKRIDI